MLDECYGWLSDFRGGRLLMYEMNLTDGLKLLRDYAEYGDEAAFRKLVEQYIDLVYSAAMRRVGGDASLAQDVTQTVFTDLARKAESLRRVEMLGGWLHRHTVFVASNIVRGERRRQVREQEAAQMNATSESPDALWQQLAPVLDDTIESLEPDDRQAVLLRFFERRDFRSIGAALGISDDAAQKRVSRALEKLRALLTERGVTLSIVLLSGLLAGKVIAAAPAGLAGTISSVALSGAAGGGAGMALFKLSKTVPLKTALAAVVAAVALWLYLGHWPASTIKPEQAAAAPVVAQAGTTNGPEDGQSLAMAPAAKTTDTNVTGKVLLLNIVTADSGKPIPDVNLDYWVWKGMKTEHKDSLRTTRFGICQVPVPDDTTEMKLVSQKDGFADTLLDWGPEHGDQIPAQYTLRVARAVPIGGQVVDPDGNPVAGAEIGIGNRTEAGSETRPQSDDFGWPFWITTTADAQGHWQINRVGKEALRTITGAASNPDYVRSQFGYGDQNTKITKQLIDGAYTFRLGRAVIVSGVVKDPNGQTVPNADVLVGISGEVNSRQTNSQSDGSFSVRGCQPGKGLITAEAKGYAATTIQVDLTNNCGPFELVLHQGKAMKLRVVDEDGNPVAKAYVYFQSSPYQFGDKETTPTQVEFDGQTDANGRLQWDSAPDGKLTFDIGATGFLGKDWLEVPADGLEHVITLQPGLTINGTVIDATTGQPIPRFRIVTGWPNVNPIDHTTNLTWSTIDRFWLNFSGGKFQYTYNEEVLGGVKDPTYVFKFEAEGYATFISRCVPAMERSVHFDVALKPVPTTEVTVFTPDGGLATGSDIGLVSPGAGLSLVPGGFSRNNLQSGGTLLLTDDQGQFALPSDPTITKVVAASPQGYAEATSAELETNKEMNLLPWGRLEGTYMTNGQPFAGCHLMFKYAQESMDTVSCDYAAFQTRTDNEGHFIFAQVPPGNFKVMLMLNYQDDGKGSSGWGNGPSQLVTINPGETTTITIDDTNGIAQRLSFGN